MCADVVVLWDEEWKENEKKLLKRRNLNSCHLQTNRPPPFTHPLHKSHQNLHSKSLDVNHDITMSPLHESAFWGDGFAVDSPIIDMDF